MRRSDRRPSTRPRGSLRLALLTLLALACAPVVLGIARAGGLEPFLERIAQGRMSKTALPASPPTLAWDTSEAARGRARVFVQREAGVDWNALRSRLTALDPSLSWEGEVSEFAQVVVDDGSLVAIARSPGVAYVARPPRGVPLIESEGLSQMKVPEFQAMGYTGAGARIAILDLGFAGYQDLLGTELPMDVKVKSFFRSPQGSGDITGENQNHGTACAEIVHDVAPEAQLYLVNAESPADLAAAVDWLIEQDVSVISHSIGWYWGGLDGTGPIDQIAENAASHGILWVNASGNEALRHTWTHDDDADGDGLIDLENDGGAEQLDFSWDRSHQELTLALLWNAWPTSSGLDFRIELADTAGTVLATSSPIFPGMAAQYLEYSGSLTSPPARARIRITEGSPGGGHILHLFRIGQGSYMYPCGTTCPGTTVQQDRSLLAPADSRAVIAAGATDWRTEQIDSYSSRNTALLKPETYGPVGVRTATYPTPPFFRGTSAAAPHVAGAAGLLASSGIRGGLVQMLWSRDDLIALLSAAALPVPDAPEAWGIVRLPLGPIGGPAAEGGGRPGPRILGNPAFGRVRWDAGCDAATVLDAAGRIIARSIDGGTWSGRDDAGKRCAPGIYWVRCPDGGASRVVWLGPAGSR